ncbi:MAG: radical SAM protein, partial [Elusimicrobia bacterium]|nr:radical SAM protein [Elusimicrobiota bacterium]
MVNNNIFVFLENIVSKYFKDYNPSFFVLDFIKNLNFMNDEKLLCICNDFLSSKFDYNDIMSIKIRNRILNELEIFQRKPILESKPRDIQVVLTNKCNLRCKMCVNDRIKWELPKETLESIKNNMKYMERILWQGGEAFLYPNFLELLILAHENCVVQSIMTNGLLIDEKTADVITKTNTDIVISVDSVTPSVYENIRSGAKFEQLINSLELLSKYRVINNSKTSLDMATIIMHSSCRDLFNFIDFAE